MPSPEAARIAKRTVKHVWTITIETFADPADDESEHAIVTCGRDDDALPWCGIADSFQHALIKVDQDYEERNP